MKHLDDVLNVEPAKSTELVPFQKQDSTGDAQVQDDFQFARENLMDVISKGQAALFDLMDVAKQSQHPRAYEVLSTLMNTMVGASKDLLDLQAKKKKLLENEPDASPQQVTNNLFVGSTAELQKYLKNRDVES